METGGRLKFQEIENVSSRFKMCPKCNSIQGFWLGLKGDKAFVQCKECGTKFELHEVYPIDEKGKTSARFSFFRK